MNHVSSLESPGSSKLYWKMFVCISYLVQRAPVSSWPDPAPSGSTQAECRPEFPTLGSSSSLQSLTEHLKYRTQFSVEITFAWLHGATRNLRKGRLLEEQERHMLCYTEVLWK